MPHKIFISDLDGTLLRNDVTLSDFSKQSIQQLVNRGVHFSVASARSVVAIRKMFDGVKLKYEIHTKPMASISLTHKIFLLK